MYEVIAELPQKMQKSASAPSVKSATIPEVVIKNKHNSSNNILDSLSHIDINMKMASYKRQ